MVWLIAIAAVVGFLIWFFFGPQKPVPRPLISRGALFEAIESLHNLGIEGGEIRIQVKDDPARYVTLTKHIRSPGKVEIVGVLPLAPLSPEQQHAVRACLARSDIAGGESAKEGQAWLEVRFGENWRDAEVFVRTAMEVGFGVYIGADCVAYAKNIVIWNKPSLTGIPNP